MNASKIGVLAIVGLVALLGVGLGARVLVLWILDGGLDRVWAVAVTVALPLVAFGCYRLGRTESRGTLAGIQTGLQMGVSQVHDAAAKAVDLRVTSVRRVKEALTDQPPVVILPDPGADFRMRPQLPGGNSVDL